MGCDIHIQAEVLGPDGVWRWLEPTWENTPPISDERRSEAKRWGVPPCWYDGRSEVLFARLAGVRDESAAIFPARGWPDDLDPDTQRALWDGEEEDLSGLHHHSWLTLEEGNHEGLRVRGCEGWGAVIGYVIMEALFVSSGAPGLPGLLKRVRLVFAFDN